MDTEMKTLNLIISVRPISVSFQFLQILGEMMLVSSFMKYFI